MKDEELCKKCLFPDAHLCEFRCKDKIQPLGDNKPLILQFIEEHKGELLLTTHATVVRLIGFAEDDIDYYWKVFSLETWDEQLESCACGLIPLKNVIPSKDYDYLKHFVEINEDMWREARLRDRKEKLEKELKEVTATLAEVEKRDNERNKSYTPVV